MLVAEGVLTKACRTGVKPRQFFLFNDLLVCTVQRRYYLHIYLYLQTRYLQTVYVQVYGTILVRGHKYTRQHVLPLHELSVRLLAEGEGEVTTRVNTCHVSRVNTAGGPRLGGQHQDQELRRVRRHPRGETRLDRGHQQGDTRGHVLTQANKY